MVYWIVNYATGGNQSRKQEFFGAGEVSWNRSTKIILVFQRYS